MYRAIIYDAVDMLNVGETWTATLRVKDPIAQLLGIGLGSIDRRQT